MPWLMTILESSPMHALGRVLMIGGKNFAPEYAAPSASDMKELWGRPVSLRRQDGRIYMTHIIDAERTISVLDIPNLTIAVPTSVPPEFARPGIEVFLMEEDGAV